MWMDGASAPRRPWIPASPEGLLIYHRSFKKRIFSHLSPYRTLLRNREWELIPQLQRTCQGMP